MTEGYHSSYQISSSLGVAIEMAQEKLSGIVVVIEIKEE